MTDTVYGDPVNDTVYGALVTDIVYGGHVYALYTWILWLTLYMYTPVTPRAAVTILQLHPLLLYSSYIQSCIHNSTVKYSSLLHSHTDLQSPFYCYILSYTPVTTRAAVICYTLLCLWQ